MTVYCLQLHIIDCCEEACSSSLFQDNLSEWNLLKKNYDIVNDFKLNSVSYQEKNILIRHRSGRHQELKPSTRTFNGAVYIGRNTSN